MPVLWNLLKGIMVSTEKMGKHKLTILILFAYALQFQWYSDII